MMRSWWLDQVRKGQVWCALLSLSLGLSIATTIQAGRSSRDIERFRLVDRAVDPSLTSSFEAPTGDPSHALFSFSLVASFVLIFWLLSLLNGWLYRVLDAGTVAGEKSGLLLLSQLSLGLYGLHLITPEAIPDSLREGLHLLAGLLLLSMVVKRVVAPRLRKHREWVSVWGMLSDNQLMLASLFVPAVVIAVFDGLSREVIEPLTFLSSGRDFLAYLVLLVVLLLTYALVLRRSVAAGRGGLATTLYDLNTAMIVAGAPWLLMPLGLQLTNELQYTFEGLDPRWSFHLCVLLLMATSVVLFVMQRRGVIRLSGAAVLAGFYFPVTVATLASFQSHRHTMRIEKLDYLASADPVLPAQQWLDFGRIPLLDFIPAHGLSDFGIQWVYSLFNGTQGLDMLVWLPWIPTVIGFVVIYSFLSVVTSPLLALLVTVSLPVRGAVVGQYAVALFPATLLVLALRRPSFNRYLVLWLGSLALVLWRPDLGWPVLISLLVTVVLEGLFENREHLSDATIALGMVLGAIPVLLVLAEVVGTGDTLETVRGLVGWIAWGGARGVGSIATSPGSIDLALLLQRALPVMAAVGLLYYLTRRVVGGVAFSPQAYAVLFLVVFSLLIPARLERSQEGALFDPSLLLLMLALLPVLLLQVSARRWMSGRGTWLIGILVFTALLGRIDVYHLVGQGAGHQIRAWQGEEMRVHFDHRQHDELVEVLQQELEPGQTFLDFTNSPVLYALASTRVPFFRSPDFRVTSEARQRAQIEFLEEYREKHGLPLVILQAPPEVLGSGQEAPVAAISYRLTEYLYREYLPFARVSGWEIWRERGVQRGNPAQPARLASPSSIVQRFWLGALPFRWAKGDPWQSGQRTDLLASLLSKPSVLHPNSSLPLSWDPEVPAGAGSYLQIRARSLPDQRSNVEEPVEPILTVVYGGPRNSSFRLTLAPWTEGESEGREVLELPLRRKPRMHSVAKTDPGSERLVLLANGSDPWVSRFAETSVAGDVEPGEELWLSLRYRSNRSGTGQVFFSANDRRFRPQDSVRVSLDATRAENEVAQVRVPVVGIEAGRSLVDLRFDPPDGTEFEIVRVDLERHRRELDEYLVRLSTQWRWFSDDIRSLELYSDSPVMIDSVNLRVGD